MNCSIKDIRQNGETYIKISYSMKSLCLKVALLLISASFPAFAQLGDVWHVPDQTRSSGVYPAGMRDPLNPLTSSASVTFHQGVYKGAGDNQTGGTLYYRFGGGSWQDTTLLYHANETGTNVQIWKSSVPISATAGTVVDYYFATTFDNRTSPT